MCNDKGAVKLWLLSTVLNKIISLLSLFSGNCVSPHPSGMSWFMHGIVNSLGQGLSFVAFIKYIEGYL